MQAETGGTVDRAGLWCHRHVNQRAEAGPSSDPSTPQQFHGRELPSTDAACETTPTNQAWKTGAVGEGQVEVLPLVSLDLRDRKRR